ncbi:hypothetical protein [Paenibacillus sp.]|uniref:hypothetical protein n=1 Tax=Paenibacillus sp. TaxID=58172 RepID=UPI0028AD558D|nr:hypothetical protein [Paenibacillus sp.]
MSSSGRITDEAGYQKSLGWLVEKAVILEDPLIDPEEKTVSCKGQQDMKKELFSQLLLNRKLLGHDPNNLTYPDKVLSASRI